MSVSEIQETSPAHLPAHRILPVQVQAIKVMLLNELNHVIDELLPSGRTIHQSAVLASQRVIPATNSNENLHSLCLQLCHLFIEFCQRYKSE